MLERNFTVWTPDDDAVLVDMTTAGYRTRVVAERLGRTPGSVRRRLRLLRHDGSPITCARCRQVKPAEMFRPAMRLDYGYCLTCDVKRKAEGRQLQRQDPATRSPQPTTPEGDDRQDRPPRANRPWTDRERLQVLALVAQGRRFYDVARQLQRTPGAVYNETYRWRQAWLSTYRCSGCRQELPAEQFGASQRFTGAMCLLCHRAYSARRIRASAPADGR